MTYKCTCPEDWQGMDHTAGCKTRADRRAEQDWPEVTPEQVQQIDKILAPEFAKGVWQTVERE